MPRTVKARLDARDALRLEAQLAADDPDDLAEARRVRVEMDMLAAPSPKDDLSLVRGEVFPAPWTA